MSNEIWVLGGTGRTGKAVATRLHRAGLSLALIGRDRERLAGVAAELDGAPRLFVGSLDAALAELAREAPAVLINTVGPFASTAARVARACPPGTHYVDVANELPAVQAILELDQQAKNAGQVLVAGAGFGVLASESVVLRLCEGRSPALRVRVDAVPSVALEPGVIGSALAGTILDGLPSGGRQVRDGRLARARLSAEAMRLTTPDGDLVTTASLPSGELLAAWHASRADAVVCASSEVPTGAWVQLILPVASALLRLPAIARFAVRRLAQVPLKARARPRPHSWAHARVEWASGEVREGWLRAGDDAMTFTATAVAEVAQRLARGEGRPGAYTPGALFGPALAEAVGGEFFIEEG
ncbi:saccharopine dehydrogenase NADP-binding domain-containing protein [Deinococcus sp.]|uniref:saccharopine dehydrogenase NADP-binding domain-containing protein n=1 Tax=Deinococcus sp. TaxID=47478 RepID=UPI003CC53E3E